MSDSWWLSFVPRSSYTDGCPNLPTQSASVWLHILPSEPDSPTMIRASLKTRQVFRAEVARGLKVKNSHMVDPGLTSLLILNEATWPPLKTPVLSEWSLWCGRSLTSLQLLWNGPTDTLLVLSWTWTTQNPAQTQRLCGWAGIGLSGLSMWSGGWRMEDEIIAILDNPSLSLHDEPEQMGSSVSHLIVSLRCKQEHFICTCSHQASSTHIALPLHRLSAGPVNALILWSHFMICLSLFSHTVFVINWIWSHGLDEYSNLIQGRQ